MCMKTAYPKKVKLNIFGVGFRVFDKVCLPYPIFCFTRIIRKNRDKEVTEIVHYRKFRNNSSPVEEV